MFTVHKMSGSRQCHTRPFMIFWNLVKKKLFKPQGIFFKLNLGKKNINLTINSSEKLNGEQFEAHAK